MADSFLTEALIFLGAAIVVVSICNRLGMSSVLGYLLAGVIIGPSGLGLIGDAAQVLRFAELGVVLLLFIIGLELHPKRLWVMRQWVFGLGVMQLVVSSVMIGGVLWLFGLPPRAVMLLGVALALSSTAFALQLLGERKELQSAHGRAAFGTLLLQDLAVIPVLAVLGLLSPEAPTAEHGTAMQPLHLLALAIGVVLARFLLRPLLRMIATTGIHELFTAAALTLVVGGALAMASAGLSMGLGAFVAGILVADSEYRQQLQTDVDPFKGLLLGLFFIAVGMSVNVALVLGEPLWIVALTGSLMLTKALLLLPLGAWYGLPRIEAVRTALVLSQGGEFAFVLLSAGLGARFVTAEVAETAVVVVTSSMALTPLVMSLGDRVLERRSADDRPFDAIAQVDDRGVVIAGFGRVGQIVARVLTMQHIPFTALDANPQHVDFVRRFGNETYFGDANRLDVLQAAGVSTARALVVAVSSEEASLNIVRQVKSLYPWVQVLVRARTRQHNLELLEAGADFVLRETLLSSLALATELLTVLGRSPEEASVAVARFQEHDARTLARQAAVFHDEDAFRTTTLDATEELKRLFDADVRAAAAKDA